MTDIGVYEAKTHFSELAERVAKGESFTITRRGEPIGTFNPIKKRISDEEMKEIMDDVRRIRATCEPVTLEEILEWKTIGRR